VWIYTVFFPALFPSRVILCAIGPMGSGKTTTVKLVGRTFFGPSFDPTPLPHKPDDLDAALTNETFVLLDNADKRESWLEDKLAVAATGGSVTRRALFTTNEHVRFPIRAAIAITARTPQFRREDVADRLLLLFMERFQGFTAQQLLEAVMASRRDELMTRLVRGLPPLLRALRDTQGESPRSSFRMADFAAFAHRVGPCFGFDANAVEATLRGMGNIQRRFSSEDEPVIDLLDRWLTPANIGRWIPTSELFGELRDAAQGYHGLPQLPFDFKDARQLGMRLTDLRGTLEHLFDFHEETRKANKRWMAFRRRETPSD
jgi:hypothetical protein